jgi:hypothetical protein
MRAPGYRRLLWDGVSSIPACLIPDEQPVRSSAKAAGELAVARVRCRYRTMSKSRRRVRSISSTGAGKPATGERGFGPIEGAVRQDVRDRPEVSLLGNATHDGLDVSFNQSHQPPGVLCDATPPPRTLRETRVVRHNSEGLTRDMMRACSGSAAGSISSLERVGRIPSTSGERPEDRKGGRASGW